MRQDLEILEQHGSEHHLFLIVKRLDTVQHELEQEIQTTGMKFTKIYEMKTSLPTSSFSSFSELFGALEIEETAMKDVPQLTKVIQSQVLLQRSGDLRLKQTVNLLELVGISYIDVWKACYFPKHNKVGLSNTHNNCIHVFDVKTGTLRTKKLDENAFPYYISTFDQDHAIVATISGAVLKIDISTLKIKEQIEVPSTHVFPLCYVNKHLVLCRAYESLAIMKNNRVLNYIPLDCEVGYICPFDEDKFIYTSYYGSLIRCMALEGETVFEHTTDDLTKYLTGENSNENVIGCHPMGVAVDRNSYIYVAFIQNHEKIIRLTPEGKFDKVVLYKGAYGIACNDATQELVIIPDLKSLEFYKIE